MGDNVNKNDGGDYEEFCMICRRPESLAGKLLHLPGNVYVCSHCMDKMSKIIEENYGDILNGAMANPMAFMNVMPMNQTTDPSAVDKTADDGGYICVSHLMYSVETVIIFLFPTLIYELY